MEQQANLLVVVVLPQEMTSQTATPAAQKTGTSEITASIHRNIRKSSSP